MTTSTQADHCEARRNEGLESRMMRKYPVRFGGGRMEKVRTTRNLASRLPYFLTLADDAHERELQRGLLAHIRQFLLELGAGFAFVGENVHLEVGDSDFYLDLLFYHLRLRAYIVI